MNVVLVADEVGFPRGYAATNYVRLLARGLVSAGANAHFVALDYSERSSPPLNTLARGTEGGVTFEYTTGSPILPRFPPAIALGRAVSHARFVADMARRARVDAILYYGRWPSELAVAMTAARLARAPLLAIVVEWRLAFPNQTRSQRLNDRLFCRMMRRLDGAIVLSNYLQERVRPLLAPHAPCLKAPIVTDASVYEGVVPARRDGRYIVFCADLVAYLDDAVEVIRATARLPAPLELVIVGSANDAAVRRLQQEAKNGAVSLTLLTEYVSAEDLRALYSGAAALVAPLPDTDRNRARFPSKIGDYLSSGRPVVSAKVGEVAAYLKDGESAYLAAPDDPRSLSDALARALSDPNASAVGERGRQVALQYFDHRRVGADVVEFLGPIIERSAR